MLLEAGHEHHHDSSLGGPYLINDAGDVVAVSGAHGHQTTTSSLRIGGSATPSPTLVTETGSNLEIKLIWDSSVSSAPSAFRTAIIDAAQYFVDTYINPLSGGAKDIV